MRKVLDRDVLLVSIVFAAEVHGRGISSVVLIARRSLAAAVRRSEGILRAAGPAVVYSI